MSGGRATTIFVTPKGLDVKTPDQGWGDVKVSPPAVAPTLDFVVEMPDGVKYSSADEIDSPVESFLHHFNQVDSKDQKDIADQFRRFVDKSGTRSTQSILLELEHILQNDIFQLSKCDRAHFRKFFQQLFDKGHISHYWVYVENNGANATNIPWIFFAWATSIVGFVAFLKIFNPDTPITESDLSAQFIGGIFAIVNCLQWALLFSPKLEAIITSLETHFAKSYSSRLQSWAALCQRNPKAGFLQLFEYLVTQTVQIVSNLTGGVAVPLGIYDAIQKLALRGAYFTTLLTYLGGWVFFRNYLGKDFAAFVRFALDFSQPSMLLRLFSRKFLQALNVLIEGLTSPIIKSYIVYPYISDLANEKFGWFPTNMVISCVAIQQLIYYQKTYKNHIQYSIDLKKLLKNRKNIEMLAASDLLTPEQAALIARLRQFPRFMNKAESERYLKVVDQLTDSLEKLLVKLATQHLPFGYVWKKDWKVVVTDIFASMVGGWVGSNISASLLGGPLAISVGAILGAASLGGLFHLAEATTCDDRLAYQYAVNFFKQKADEKSAVVEQEIDEALFYFQKITTEQEDKSDQKHEQKRLDQPDDAKLMPQNMNLLAPQNTDLSWSTIGKLAVVTLLVLGFSGSTLFSEMGMANKSNPILLAITAIGIMKLLVSNQKYNGEMNYDRVNRLNWNFGCKKVKPSEVKATLYHAAKVAPVVQSGIAVQMATLKPQIK